MAQKPMDPRRRAALHGLMGMLLDRGIHPDVCCLFSPQTFDVWHWGTTVAYMEERRTVVPPAIGQHMGLKLWSLDELLPAFMAQVIVDYPDASPRDHLVGGYLAVALAPWMRDSVRVLMGTWMDTVVALTSSSDVADNLPDKGRTILAAYDRALAKVAAASARHTATDEGAQA